MSFFPYPILRLPSQPLSPRELSATRPLTPNTAVNAWDNPAFRAAVEATGRKQIILGGIVTEVCTLFLALSLREAGYSVWHNAEASGTATPRLASDANRRMGMLQPPVSSPRTDIILQKWQVSIPPACSVSSAG